MPDSVRCFDLWPGFPILDNPDVPEVYVDAPSLLMAHGQNMTTTYHQWRRGADGAVRVPVVRIIRPTASLLSEGGFRAILSGQLKLVVS